MSEGGSAEASELPLDNPFWRFSLAVYGAPGVAQECLAVQERLGLDVNLLLFCAWLGAKRGVAVEVRDLEGAAAAVGVWHHDIVRELRGVRQRLKELCRTEQLLDWRKNVSRIEVQAEQIEQAMLFRWSEQHVSGDRNSSGDRPLEANVRTFLRWTAPAADEGEGLASLRGFTSAALRA